MQIVFFGATGFIGRELYKQLVQQNYNIIVVSRSIEKVKKILGHEGRIIKWDNNSINELVSCFEKDYIIINLAGENIAAKRWKLKQKQQILESRVRIVNAIVSAVQKAGTKPKIYLQASAIGYYPSSLDDKYNEDSPKGEGFLSDVVEKWEASANKLKNTNTRLVKLRTGAVLGTNAGMLAKLLPSFRYFIGGIPGNGKQWVSWIHISDVVSAILFILKNDKLKGVCNLTAPIPVRMKHLCLQMGNAINRPVWFRIPGFLLILLLGRIADELILSSQFVTPEKLLRENFIFEFSEIQDALNNILRPRKV